MLASSRLANGLALASSRIRSELSTLTVAVKAGARDELLSTGGCAHLIEHLRYTARHSVTGVDFLKRLENIGCGVQSETQREISYLILQVLKGQERNGLQLLSDMLLRAKFSNSQLETERDIVIQELDSGDLDPRGSAIDLAHETAFKGHKLGKGILGTQLSLLKISELDCNKFIEDFYVGENLAVVGVGDFEHEALEAAAKECFGGLRLGSAERPNYETPAFTEGYREEAGDSLVSHVGVFLPAPGFNHKDYWSFRLLQGLMGKYEPSQDGYTDMSKVAHSRLQRNLGQMTDLTNHESLYYAYSDCGLFGHYLSCSDLGAYFALILFIKAMRAASTDLSDLELKSAKSALISSLSQVETGQDLSKYIAKRLLYTQSPSLPSSAFEVIEQMTGSSLIKTYKAWMSKSCAIAHIGQSQERLYEICQKALNS